MSPSKTLTEPEPSSIKPFFKAETTEKDSPQTQSLIKALHLIPHIEGGFYVETDRSRNTVRSSFNYTKAFTSHFAPQREGFDPAVKNASTTIFYLLTPSNPKGGFHRNTGRTIHTLHRGRGRYVIIHGDEVEKRIETFVVGQDVAKGERIQWIVPGGKYKASFLLPDEEDGTTSEGLLISETVVPGFEFCDHDFLTKDGLEDLVGKEKFQELKWLLKPE
jgi:predicted cupin superfamily sugar epimerase